MNRKDFEGLYVMGAILKEYSMCAASRWIRMFFLLLLGVIFAYYGIHQTIYSVQLLYFIIIAFLAYYYTTLGNPILFLCEKGIIVEYIPPGTIGYRFIFWRRAQYCMIPFPNFVGFSKDYDGIIIVGGGHYRHPDRRGELVPEGGSVEAERINKIIIPCDVRSLSEETLKYVTEYAESYMKNHEDERPGTIHIVVK